MHSLINLLVLGGHRNNQIQHGGPQWWTRDPESVGKMFQFFRGLYGIDKSALEKLPVDLIPSVWRAYND